jgi:hypothetical protein
MIKASYLSLVAGKAEQMATIVKEFVDGSAVDERRRSLLRTDEIDRQQHQEATEDCPGHKLTKGNGWDGDRLMN